MSELFKPATELATPVHAGQISSAELVGAALERIEALQPDSTRSPTSTPRAPSPPRRRSRPTTRGRSPASRSRSRTRLRWPGCPTRWASDIFGDFVPGHDAFLVRRLREAGFVIVGKTSMPEFGILPVSEPRRFGPVRNPWDTGAHAGRLVRRGRRGGGGRDAAARPRQRRRRVDPHPGGVLRPGWPEAQPRAHLARSRSGRRLPRPGRRAYENRGRDGRAARRARRLRGRRRDLGPASLRAVRRRCRREPGPAPDRLHHGPPSRPARPDLRAQAVRDAAELLAELGHEVEEVAAPWGTTTCSTSSPWSSARRSRWDLLRRHGHRPRAEPGAGRAALLDDLGGHPGRTALDYLLARTQLTGHLARDHRPLGELRRDAHPGLAERPVRIGEIDACSDDPWEDFGRSGRFTPYTAIFNVTGQPAISVPLFHGDDGLPLSIQLAGRPADEATLLRSPAQLEAAGPWADRRPRSRRPPRGPQPASSTSRSRS